MIAGRKAAESRTVGLGSWLETVLDGAHGLEHGELSSAAAETMTLGEPDGRLRESSLSMFSRR